MKPVTVDMLRAHLLVASLTAALAELLLCVALPLLPVSENFFASMPFRLGALALIVGGVFAAREFAQLAFDFAVRRAYAEPAAPAERGASTSTVALAADCPQRWLVVLHLRLTGQAFVLAGR
ncbi:hypothetical protein BTH42_15065 [Burkholderia sp. SRS-W-2-2016]|uniref:hypothetical protein n=1 Tax=Burkholderia sp. SRS-W-2-2016 TaxID=1926878 RepID=UPI00094B15A7|nr:hypothetical protein [Burkholderia sp. SRS-W-2-2016]OLL30801.1 hypothetical protein BTH42_15065 [Burkholderia sp. SRS-W-2-2016]